MARKQPILPDEHGNYTEKQLKRLTSRARNVCTWYLEKKRYTRKELEKKLVERQIPEDIIEETLLQLETEGRINDVEYAELFTESKRKWDKLGTQSIRQKLRMKGIPEDIISNVLSTLDEDDLKETAIELINKRLKHMDKLDTTKRTSRLVSMLAYKGYNAGLAYNLVKDAIAEYDENKATQLDS